jgi:hypothetical protein
LLGSLAVAGAIAFFPGAAAAQCEGGLSTGGYYSRNGGYAPGGCAYTSTSTPGQLYPSGAQPLPSTMPVQGLSALPGQQVATGLLPVTSGDLGQPLGALGAPQQSLGPGADNNTPVITLPPSLGGVGGLPGEVTPSGVLPVNTANVGSALGINGMSNGLVNTVNNGTTTGITTPNASGFVAAPGTRVGPDLVNGTTATRGLAPSNGTSTINGVGMTPNVVVPAGGTAPFATTTSGQPLNGRGELLTPAITAAYGYTLPAAPAVSASTTGPSAPAGTVPPPAPGRGGPTYIGEEGSRAPIISVP